MDNENREMQSWEYTYQYVIRGDKIMVAPVFEECADCEYTTWRSLEMMDHQVNRGHFYRTRPSFERIEEWNAGKHGEIPVVYRRKIPDKIKNVFLKNK